MIRIKFLIINATTDPGTEVGTAIHSTAASLHLELFVISDRTNVLSCVSKSVASTIVVKDEMC